MANDLVVQLGARLDQFQSDMNQAGDIADSTISRIESSFSDLNPGFNLSGFATIVTGAVGGATALLAVLQHVNGELADIARNAEYAGVSVEDFQRIKFGATQGGVGDQQATADLRNVARLLADAKENENSLTKLLDTNNVKYADRNGDVIKLNQLLTIAGDLINRFRSMPEKVEAAKALGLSESWVQALRNGSKAFDDVANSADAAGAVIDRSTIAKAEAFDTAWKKSSSLLSSQFKAAIGDIAGWFDTLIDKAAAFIESTNKANAPANPGGSNKFADWADSIVISARIDDGTASVKDLERAIEIIAGHDQIVPQALFDQLAQLKKEAAATAKAVDEVNRATQASNFPNGVPLPASRPAGADATADSDAKLAARKKGNGARDQFNIAVDDITKRTATIKADTAAVFENNAVQAQYRAEFRELTAIMRDNGEVTQQQIDAYEKLRTTMSAQQALTAAGIVLAAEHAQKFVSSSEAIKAATASYDKAHDSLAKINSASQTIGSAFSTAFSDAIIEGKSLNDVLASLLKTLEKAALNSVFTSVFNPGTAGGLSPFANFLGLGSIIGHNAAGTDDWSGGPTWVGEKGPEIVNLPRGAQVVPNAIAARRGGGDFAPVFNIDASGADPQAISRLQAVLAATVRDLQNTKESILSSQRYQATGVN